MRRVGWNEAMKADKAENPQITVGRIAAQMGKSESLVYKMLEGEFAPSITQLVDFADLTGGKNIMRWLGRMTNHYVAPIPMERADDLNYADLLREFSEAVTEYTLAVSDGNISREEAKAVGVQLDELIVAAQRLRIGLERHATTIPLRPSTMAEAERKGASNA